MKANRHNRGSVLMEFVIVFPVYLVLMGGVFMIGDMLVKTSRLAAADRTRAFDVAATTPANAIASFGWEAIKDLLFPPTSIQEDDVSNECYRFHKQGTGFNGPWTVAAGAKVGDKYKLAPWTRAWLAYSDRFLSTATKSEESDERYYDGLLSESTTQMYSKDVGNTRKYNYYTYRRTRDYSDGDLGKMYRAIPRELADAGRLVDAVASGTSPGRASWETGVVYEEFPALEGGGGEGGNKRSDVSLNLTRREYMRYDQFVTWSE